MNTKDKIKTSLETFTFFFFMASPRGFDLKLLIIRQILSG